MFVCVSHAQVKEKKKKKAPKKKKKRKKESTTTKTNVQSVVSDTLINSGVKS